MDTFKLTLELRSPLGTPLAADTLFGHLCWGIVYHEGQQALAQFLQQMDSPEPPLVISDPLPAGFLPTPSLPAPPPAWMAPLAKTLGKADKQVDKGEWIDGHDILKKWLKRRWIADDDFAAVVDSFGWQDIIQKWMKTGTGKDLPGPPAAKNAPVAHNTINRLTNHTLDEGGLFFQKNTYHAGNPRYDLWVRSTLPLDRVRQLLEWALEGGYGRDASVGLGHLVITDAAPANLPAAKQPNAMLTLGPCTPAPDDPTQGHWKVLTRFGKLGGPWAKSDDQQNNTPFKYPLLMLETAAVLFGPPRPFIGRIVHNVHPVRSEVVHYGYALTIPVHCPAAVPMEVPA